MKARRICDNIKAQATGSVFGTFAETEAAYCTLAKQMLRYYDRLEERRMEEVRRRFRERHMGH